MLNWLKKLFSKPEATMPIKEENKFLEKPCRTCGKPIFYDPSWEHIDNRKGNAIESRKIL